MATNNTLRTLDKLLRVATLASANSAENERDQNETTFLCRVTR